MMENRERRVNRRKFFGNVGKDIVQVIYEAKKSYEEAKSIADTFSSFESSASITLAYPREVFEEAARRLGINIDEVGLDTAVRLIVENSDALP
jgi:hypothetical protein